MADQPKAGSLWIGVEPLCQAGNRLPPPAAGRDNHLSALPAGWKRLIRPYVQQQAFRA
jgi:hypothetical protein